MQAVATTGGVWSGCGRGTRCLCTWRGVAAWHRLDAASKSLWQHCSGEIFRPVASWPSEAWQTAADPCKSSGRSCSCSRQSSEAWSPLAAPSSLISSSAVLPSPVGPSSFSSSSDQLFLTLFRGEVCYCSGKRSLLHYTPSIYPPAWKATSRETRRCRFCPATLALLFFGERRNQPPLPRVLV